MSGRIAAAAVLILISSLSARADENLTPAPGAADSIGAPASGCVVGARELPVSGPGWEVLRPSTHRNWGNPFLIDFLEEMAGKARRLGTLIIGDLGMPRGGPILIGHASHQLGLDVDILFRLLNKGETLSEEQREHPVFDAVMVDGKSINRALWSDQQVALLQLFAGDPRVERIFVNPVIKRDLCKTATGDRAWLRKIRPWWGHEAHFHVRLVCPPGDRDCAPRESLPEGDGCGASLDWWFTPDAARPKPRSGPPPELPAACKAILGQ
jgi:penicillin-insensitive murein endopeptidase